jgi:hypothetical protein
MTGTQLPALVGPTAARMPDAVFAPGYSAAVRTHVPAERVPPRGTDPYQSQRGVPAGLLVDLYG